LVFILLLLGGINLLPLLEIASAVLFGWVSFLTRVLPLVSLNADLTVMALVCILLVGVGTHWFLQWIAQQAALTSCPTSNSFHWPWKWTWCGLAAIGLTFFVGSAVVGMVHQVGWVIGSGEPWFEAKGRAALTAHIEMRSLESACSVVLAEPDTDVRTVRERLSWPEKKYLSNSKSIRQSHHLLALLTDDGRVTSLVFFPRAAKQRERFGAFITTKDGAEPLPAAAIDEWLRRHQARLVAL
jgi:hypothetical protein